MNGLVHTSYNKKQDEDKCCWVWDELNWLCDCKGFNSTFDNTYNTGFHDSQPNMFKFCPYCGKPIKVVDNE